VTKVSNSADLSRTLRKALGGKTQAELAAILLVSRNYISQIEAKLKNPSPRLESEMRRLLTEVEKVSTPRERPKDYVQEEGAGFRKPLPSNPALQEYLDMLRGCADEATRLSNGDTAKATALFERMLDTWTKMISGTGSDAGDETDVQRKIAQVKAQLAAEDAAENPRPKENAG
jgi:transcriptional regulator with XRE-family HTH domain